MSFVREIGHFEKQNSETFIERVGQVKWAKHVLAFFIGSCLAQSVMFYVLVPFFMPFWAITQRRFEHYKWTVLLGGFLSASTLTVGQGLLLLVQVGLYEILSRFKLVRVPTMIALLFSVLLGQLGWRMLNEGTTLTIELWLYVIYETAFAVVMLLFLERLFADERKLLYQWSEDRIVAGVVFLAAILLGLSSWQFMNLNMAIILFQVAVCVAAYVGRMSLAIVVSTLVGLLFAVSELALSGMIGLYVLTGLLAGVVSNTNKWLVALMSVVPSVFFYFYDATLPLDVVYFTSVMAGICVFLFLPNHFFSMLENMLTSREEKSFVERKDWVNNKVKESVERLEQFAQFLSGTVQKQQIEWVHAERDLFSSCENCYRANVCWAMNGPMQQAVGQFEKTVSFERRKDRDILQHIIRENCVRHESLLQDWQKGLYDQELRAQLFHGRRLIGLQLQHFSVQLHEIMRQLSDVSMSLEQSEDLIVQEINKHELDCMQVDIVRETKGNRYLVCHLAESISPLFWLKVKESLLPYLEQFFQEKLQVSSVEEVKYPFKHVQLKITSAQKFMLEHEVYAMSLTDHSGDTSSVFSIQNHLVGIALSDGMGHGIHAKNVSEEMIRLLKGHLHYGLNAEMALHLMHYVVGLNEMQDMYASLDFLMLDLQTGELLCWKAGSVSTYILRGGRVIILENETGPVGKSLRYDMECQRFKLLAGDVIFIVSDGIFHSQKDWARQEQEFVQAIERNYEPDWSLASILVNTMNDYRTNATIDDDCTLIACRVEHLQQRWYAFTQ